MTATTNGHSSKVLDEINNVSNGGKTVIDETAPYVATVTIVGTAPILFHGWNVEAVKEKGAAAKGSDAKKSDDLESFIYRCDDGTIGIPGSYLIGSVIDKKNGSAKYLQDPRSPRKSALDLYKAGVVPITIMSSLGKTTWDFVDRRRVTVQLAGITRHRPAFHAGWRATFELAVLTPEYISPSNLLKVLTEAGRLVGLGDYRPTFGRFQVVSFTTDRD